VLLVMEHASRRVIHLKRHCPSDCGLDPPTAARGYPSDPTYPFIRPDRDAIFSTSLDASGARMRVEVIKTPVPQPAGEFALRKADRDPPAGVPGLDDPRYLKSIFEKLCGLGCRITIAPDRTLLWGPSLPDPPLNVPTQLQRQRHLFDRASRVLAHLVLNRLHHEYTLLDHAA